GPAGFSLKDEVTWVRPAQGRGGRHLKGPAGHHAHALGPTLRADCLATERQGARRHGDGHGSGDVAARNRGPGGPGVGGEARVGEKGPHAGERWEERSGGEMGRLCWM